MEIDNHTKGKLKLLRFWLKRDLKPFIRIEPKISHLNVDFFKARETNKVFNDPNLFLIKDKLKFKDILELNLTPEDKRDLIKIHCPEVVTKLRAF